MGSDVSSHIPYLRGLGLPHMATLDHLWRAETTATEQAPRVGEAIPEQTTSAMRLATSGTQSSGGSLVVRSQSAGHPRPGQGGFVHQDSGDTDYYGWDVPSVSQCIEHISRVDGSGTYTIRQWYPPDAIGLDNNRALIVAHARLAATHQIKAWHRDTAGTWTSVVVSALSGAAPTGMDYYPCALDLGDGVVIVAFWVFDTAANEAQIRVSRSTDSGETWARLSSYALSAPVSTSTYTVGRLRMAYADDQILLVAAVKEPGATNYTDQIMQFASSSRGRTFDLVEVADDVLPIVSPDVVAVDGQFLVGYIGASGLDKLYVRRLPFASSPFSEQDDVVAQTGSVTWCPTSGVGPADVTDGEMSMEVDDAGAIWLIARYAATGAGGRNQMLLARSNDSGATWSDVGSGPLGGAGNFGLLWDSSNSAISPVDYAPFWVHGRMLCASLHRSVAGTWENSLSVLHIGGYTNVTMPGLTSSRQDTRRANMTHTWGAFDTPDAGYWTAAGLGTTAITAAGDMTLTTVANTRDYTNGAAINGAVAEGVTVLFGVRVDSGGSTATDACSVEIVNDDGVEGYSVTIRMSSAGGFAVHDDVLPGNIGTSVAALTTNYHWILVSINDGTCSVWRRSVGISDRWVWTNVVDGVALSDSGGTAGAKSIQWGNRAAANVTSAWVWFAFTSDAHNGLGLADGLTNPDDLFPRFYGGPGRRVYVRDGVRITAASGPADEGDEYTVSGDADYPVDLVNFRHSPTPRRQWASVAAASPGTAVATNRIAYYFDANLTASGQETKPLADTIGFAILNTNARSIVVKGYTGGAWATLFTTTTVWSTGALTRKGRAFTASTAHSGSLWTWPGMLVGGTIKLVDGGTTVYRKIVEHSEGGMFAATSGRQCVMHCEGVEATDPASGGASSEIWSPNALITINLKGAAFSGFMVEFSSQVTADDDLRAGLIVPFYLMPFGFMDANGWAYETLPGVAVHTTEDGVEIPVYRSPGRRVLTLNLGDPMDLTGFRGAAPQPDYIRASANGGAEPVASRHDMAAKILHYTRALAGEDPVVWIDRLDKTAAAGPDTNVMLALGTDFMVATATGSTTLQHVTGLAKGKTTDIRHGELAGGASYVLREVI